MKVVGLRCGGWHITSTACALRSTTKPRRLAGSVRGITVLHVPVSGGLVLGADGAQEKLHDDAERRSAWERAGFSSSGALAGRCDQSVRLSRGRLISCAHAVPASAGRSQRHRRTGRPGRVCRSSTPTTTSAAGAQTWRRWWALALAPGCQGKPLCRGVAAGRERLLRAEAEALGVLFDHARYPVAFAEDAGAGHLRLCGEHLRVIHGPMMPTCGTIA